jgi:hypothetical protein
MLIAFTTHAKLIHKTFTDNQEFGFGCNIHNTYSILLSIVRTFLHWKWCWNIPCALYMEGSWERVRVEVSFYDNKRAMIISFEIILEK